MTYCQKCQKKREKINEIRVDFKEELYGWPVFYCYLFCNKCVKQVKDYLDDYITKETK